MGQCIVARLLEYTEKWLCVTTTQDEVTQLCSTERNIKRMNLVFVPWSLNVFKNIFCSSCRQMGSRMSVFPLFQRWQTCRSTYNWDTRRNASRSLRKLSVMLVLFYHLTSQNNFLRKSPISSVMKVNQTCRWTGVFWDAFLGGNKATEITGVKTKILLTSAKFT